MKKRYVFITAIILMLTMPVFSEEKEKNDILNAMTFPSPDIRLGNTLNDPFFAINIRSRTINVEEIKKKILYIEKGLNARTDPEIFYKLGNYYKDINDKENAIKNYKKYLNLTSSEDKIRLEDIKTIPVKGDIYYSLSEIDLKTGRIENLEKSLLYLTKSIELNPEDRTLWIKFGDCYLSAGKTTEALYCYNKALDKNKSDFQIYPRLQAAAFQRDYLKLARSKTEDKIENPQLTQDLDLEYLETAINNSPSELKDSLKLQQYIYLLRIMLFKNEYYKNIQFDANSGMKKDEEIILTEAEKLLKSAGNGYTENMKRKYLSGIINYLKADYKKAISDLKEILNDNNYPEMVYDDILFIILNDMKDNNELKKTAEDMIKNYPDPNFYLLLAEIEFKDKNYLKAEMLSAQALKIERNFAEAYSASAVIYAINGNYTAADDMIKKGIFVMRDNKYRKKLYAQMRVNEAAIALLKNEKERAYILLRSVISVDNNDKAQQLYDRYFTKNEKIQN